jgi:hypothetical protein
MSALFSCREASRLASTAIDRPLPFLRRVELRMHLAMCAACRAYRRQISAIDRVVRGRAARIEADSEIRLDPEARRRIAEALRRR